MTALKMAAIIAESALATLRQVAGIDPRELDIVARAIGNNAAMALTYEENSDEENSDDDEA